MPIATPPTSTELENHPVVSQDEWMVARRQLLDEEKQALKQLDTVSAKRRALPWVKIEKPYTFESDKGSKSLSDLFDGRSQLIVYHFMFGPGWKEGCDGCSFLSDHFDGANWHLPHHDVTLLAVSRAPWQRFNSSKNAWVGVSHGCLPSAAISTTTFMRPPLQEQRRFSITSRRSMPPRRAQSSTASVSFIKTVAEKFTIPTRPTPAALISCVAHTICSISRRKDATKPAP